MRSFPSSIARSAYLKAASDFKLLRWLNQIECLDSAELMFSICLVESSPECTQPRSLSCWNYSLMKQD